MDGSWLNPGQEKGQQMTQFTVHTTPQLDALDAGAAVRGRAWRRGDWYPCGLGAALGAVAVLLVVLARGSTGSGSGERRRSANPPARPAMAPALPSAPAPAPRRAPLPPVDCRPHETCFGFGREVELVQALAKQAAMHGVLPDGRLALPSGNFSLTCPFNSVCQIADTRLWVRGGMRLRLQNVRILRHRSRSSGALLAVTGGGRVVGANVEFDGGATMRPGGGLGGALFMSSLALGRISAFACSDCSFVNNKAEYSGGGIYNSLSALNLTRAKFVGNSCEGGSYCGSDCKCNFAAACVGCTCTERDKLKCNPSCAEVSGLDAGQCT